MIPAGRFDLLATRRGRIVLFAALYMSEGAPIGFIWWALPTRLRAAEVPVAEITLLTSLVTLPWAFKFLWAPLVDRVRSPRWTLRSWIISSQVAMGGTLLPLLWLDFQADFSLALGCLLAHAFCAATQDVAVDALSIATVPEAERGAINGWMQAGMLAGRSVVAGFALTLATLIGEQGLVLALIVLVWSSLALLLASREPGAAHETAAAGESLLTRLHAIARRRNTWLGLGFAVLGGAGFEAVGAVAGPFMVDRGVSPESIGVFFSLVTVPCMIGGALAGGLVADRAGKRVACAGFLIVLGVAIAALSALDVGPTTPHTTMLLSMLGVVYVGIGLFTSASYALFMDLTDPALAATQFSAFMALTNVCESWSAFAVGRLVANAGYPTAFLVMAGLSLGALPLLRAMSPLRSSESPAASIEGAPALH